MVSYYVKRGYIFFCEDETTYSLKPHTARGWYPKGSRPTVEFNFTRKRFHAYGAVNGRKEHYRFYQQINWKNTLNFLKYLHYKYSKLFIIWDNPTWHRHHKVKKYLKKNHIKTLEFPTCTPELNPIEQAWKTTKQKTANKHYSNIQEYLKQVKHAIQQKNLTKIYQYLSN